MASPLHRPVKIALIQLLTVSDKATNLLRASGKVSSAARSGAKIVVLPECFNSPYGTSHFRAYAEPIPSPTTAFPESATPTYTLLSTLASTHKIYLIGGSIPELDPESSTLYNTSLTFSPTGALLALHRKVHLFDMHIPGKISFLESSVLSPGSHATVVDTEFGKVGIGICHDVRFPELAMLAARRGAFAMVYPGAFNMATGPIHWELLARARAVDNQVYVVMCSTARCSREEGEKGTYVAFGNSLVVGPDGGVMARTDENEGVVECTLVPEGIGAVRASIPVTVQRRFDVYGDVAVVPPGEVGGRG